jgi:hypothetical protein
MNITVYTSEPVRPDETLVQVVQSTSIINANTPNNIAWECEKHRIERIYLTKKTSNGPGGKFWRAPPRPRVGGIGGGGSA